MAQDGMSLKKNGTPSNLWLPKFTSAMLILILAIGVAANAQSKSATKEVAPGGAFRDCDVICPEMVWLPKGGFLMGSDTDKLDEPLHEWRPQHKVNFSYLFAISKYPITFDEWDACLADGGCHRYRPNDNGWGRGKRPVINVNWFDARAYIQWLNHKTGKHYRLPSEAEYEYAMRGGTYTRYYTGDDPIFQANWGNMENGSTTPVDRFPPNQYGLYDMAGNVSVWLEDCYHDDYIGAPTDGRAWLSGSCENRMIRGGNWAAPQILSASNFRGNSGSPKVRSTTLGFRIALTTSK